MQVDFIIQLAILKFSTIMFTFPEKELIVSMELEHPIFTSCYEDHGPLA